MRVKITYYLEVISSWCYWAEPAWAELKRRYADKVEFGWKIAQMPVAAYRLARRKLNGSIAAAARSCARHSC